MLTVDEITTEDRFKSLQPIWASFIESCDCQSPFLTHDWFRCCLSHFREGKKLFVLTVRDGSNLIGIAPFWSYQDSIRGTRIRRIGFITSPETPFADFIVLKEKTEEALRAILNYLYITRKVNWDVLTLSQWPAESPNFRKIQELVKRQRRRYIQGVSSITPFIEIKGEWETFHQALSARFRKTHRNITNRIGKLDKVELKYFREDITGDVFRDIISVSERSWKHKEGIAISSDHTKKIFFEALTNLSGKKGWLLVWILKVNGVPIAMEYDLESDGKVHALRADFDETYRKYSPGAFLEYQIVKYLFEKNFAEYSFGPGLNNYKLHWTDDCRENIELHLCNNNLKGYIIWGIENGVIPFLRRLRDLKAMMTINRTI